MGELAERIDQVVVVASDTGRVDRVAQSALRFVETAFPPRSPRCVDERARTVHPQDSTVARPSAALRPAHGDSSRFPLSWSGSLRRPHRHRPPPRAFTKRVFDAAVFTGVERQNRDAAARRQTLRQRGEQRIERGQLAVDGDRNA